MKTVKTLTLLTICVASIAMADDFKTIAGKEYKDATVTRVEPDGILVKYKSGISKLYFAELPKEVQQRFHYDPQRATAYSVAQGANYEVYQKQQEEARHRQEDADAQKADMAAQQQRANPQAQSSLDLKEERLRIIANRHNRKSEHQSHGHTTVIRPLFHH
jgi:sRNA-binding protein